MTAVQNVSPFLTQERNLSPISESQVAKKSTTKPSKYLSDLNNLSQKSADSYTSSSQNSGPTFIENDSFADEDLNGSGDMLVNGDGSMNDEDSEMLLVGNGRNEPQMDNVKLKDTEKGEKSPVLGTNHVDVKTGPNDLDPTKESLPSSLETPEGSPSPDGTSGQLSPADSSECNDGSKSDEGQMENNVSTNGIDTGIVSDENNSTGSSEAKVTGSVQSESGYSFKVCADDQGKDDNTVDKTMQNGSTDQHKIVATNAEEENEKESELLSTNKEDGQFDSDVDDSILDDPETGSNGKSGKQKESTKHNGDNNETDDVKLYKEELEADGVEVKDDVLKTDEVVIKHDIEMTEDTECDKDSKIVDKKEAMDMDIKHDVKPKLELKSEEKTNDGNGGVKRSLSPAETSTMSPKRSKLEEMIGRLSSTVGKKPEEAENLDEVETDTSSESEASSENDKRVVLSTKELNRVIRKRMDIVLKAEKEKMQKTIEALQLNVNLWKTQAKELQKQLSELVSKGPKEKKRPSLKLRRRPPRVDVGVDTSDFENVQAAQHQQGLNSGTKSSPGTPTAPTPSRPPLNKAAAQTAITVRNAQIGALGSTTVRTLLDAQRGVVGGVTTPSTESKNVRPTTNVKKSAKQLGGCIDLTDDDEKAPMTAKQQTAVRTLVQTSQLVSPVVQAPAGLGGRAVFLQGSPSGPLVLQPVSQGMRLAQQGNVVYASAAGSPLVRGPGVVAGQVQQFKPGQQILVQTTQRSAATTVNRPPPPLKSAPSLQKHPAPLPPTPSSAGTYPKHPPPKPSLKISRVQQGIVLSWNMTLGKEHADITNYQLFAYQETSAIPSTNLWKKVGDVKALPLPMACTLTQFQEGNKYHFAVRAIDTHNRTGSFSDACSIHLSPSS